MPEEPNTSQKIFVPGSKLVQTIVVVVLFFFFLKDLPIRNDSTGATLLAMVLWGGLGYGIYEIYEHQIKPNPQEFSTTAEAKEYLQEQRSTPIDFGLSIVGLIVGAVILDIGWRNAVAYSEVYTILILFWISVVILGVGLVSSSIDNILIGLLRESIYRRFEQ